VRLQDRDLSSRMLVQSTIGEGRYQTVVSIHRATSSGASARFHCRAPLWLRAWPIPPCRTI
jgi:hypothetical protein